MFLDDLYANYIWFKQEKAKCLTGHVTFDILPDRFEGMVFSVGDNVNSG